jgi:hypothetical protein
MSLHPDDLSTGKLPLSTVGLFIYRRFRAARETRVLHAEPHVRPGRFGVPPTPWQAVQRAARVAPRGE